MEKIDEKLAFSQRLKERLAQYQMGVGPTLLARHFNHRYGGKPISIYAARKWLSGEAIPAQDKLLVLAEWLGVSPEWLRFGYNYTIGELRNNRIAEPSQEELLLSKLTRLSPENRLLISQLIDRLLVTK